MGNDRVGAAGIEARHELMLAVIADGQLRLITVTPGIVHTERRSHVDALFTLRRGNIRFIAKSRYMADMAQFTDNRFAFQFQLRFVVDLLELAASTGARDLTARRHTVRRRRDHLEHLRIAVILHHLRDNCAHKIPHDGVLHEKRQAVIPGFSYSFTLVAHIGDGDLNYIILIHVSLICAVRRIAPVTRFTAATV